MSNSLAATEEEDEFNGEAGEEGHCPAVSIEEEPNGGGKDESSHSCNGTLQDISVQQQQQSTDPSGLCVLITNPSMFAGNTFPLQLLRRRTALQHLSCQ